MKEKTAFGSSTVIAKQFDEATLQGDVVKLKTLFQEVEKDVEKGDVFYRLHTYYSLATAISSVGKLECKDGDNISLECLQKQLYYYRKAIALFEDEQIASQEAAGEIIALKAVIFTNYGNTLNDCGRKIAAIDQYNNAINGLLSAMEQGVVTKTTKDRMFALERKKKSWKARSHWKSQDKPSRYPTKRFALF